MKTNIQARINLLNIELNLVSGQKKIDCLTKLIELEKKLLDILRNEMSQL